MPTTSQCLLSRRSGESPLSTPRVGGTNSTMAGPPTSAVKSLTVTFPRVYLDQRHGHSTLRGEHGQLFLDTQDVDKIVKRYIRTGDSELHLPVAKFPRQFEIHGPTADYKAIQAKSMLPVRRIESQLDTEDLGGEKTGSHGEEADDEFDDDFCRSRPLMTFLDSMTDEELQEHKEDYVYLEINDGGLEEDSEGRDQESKEKDGTQRIMKLRKVAIPIEEGIMDEVYVDDSDLSRIKVYRIDNGNKLIFVKEIEVEGQGTSQSIDGKGTVGNTADYTNVQKSSKNTTGNQTKDGLGTKTERESKGYNKDSAFSYAEYLKENLYKDTDTPGKASGKHAGKHGHHKKTKHKHTTKGGLSPNNSDDIPNTGQGMGLQFPQKPVLPGVSSPRSPGRGRMDKINYRQEPTAQARYSKYGSTTSSPKRPTVENGTSFQTKDGSPVGSDVGDDVSSTDTLPQIDVYGFSRENTEDSTGGLSRMQQLSVEKKLKSLEPPLFFYDPPAPRPLSMCFDVTGTNNTHAQIRLAVMKTLGNIPNAKVTSLQFVARNVILGTMWVDNRWIVDLSTKQCVTVLMGRGIVLNGEQVKLRKYDDIIKEEYDKFLIHKERFSKKGGKKQLKRTILPQTNALSLLDKSLLQDTPIDGISGEQVEVTA